MVRGEGAPAHVPVLDGIRGLAILLVMILHFWVLDPQTPFVRFVGSAACMGWIGVDLFFVLSGFLITGILLDTKGTPHYFRNFYVRRVLRIFPLYYALLIAALYVLAPFLPADKAAAWSLQGYEVYYWLYASNFASAHFGRPRHGILDPTWSLAIEEQFYLFWPAIVVVLSRRNLARLVVALFFGSLALRVVLRLATTTSAWSVYVLTPCRLDGLAVGAFLAIGARTPRGLAPYRGLARVVVAATLPLVVAIPLIDEWLHPYGASAGFGLIFNVVGYSLLALLFGGLVAISVTSPRGSAIERVLSSRLMRTLGKYSYGLYLVNFPLRGLIRDRVFGPTEGARIPFRPLFGSLLPAQALFYVVSAVASFGVAWLSFHLFETPFLRLKRFFPSGHAVGAAPAGPALDVPVPAVDARRDERSSSEG